MMTEPPRPFRSRTLLCLSVIFAALTGGFVHPGFTQTLLPPVFIPPAPENVAIPPDITSAIAPGAPPVPTVIVGGAWTALGPGPTRSGQVSIPPNNEICGAIQAIAAHPTNADILYVGSVGGGVWRTANATAATPAWTPLMDAQASLNIGALEFDATDGTSQTLVAGSARLSSFGAVGGSRIGVLRTTDGGNNWTVLGGSFANENLMSVAARGSIIMAASDSQWGGGNGSGVFRSTNTGGSFTLVSGGSGLSAGPVSDLVADPNVPTRFYAAVRTAGIFRSDDTGATWTNVTGTISGITASTTKVEMAVHNNGTTNAVYVAVINSNVLASVWRSADLGVSWTQMGTPVTHNGSQGQIHFSIAADRNDANLVYIGGDRITSSPFTGNLFRGNAALAPASQFTTIMDGNANSGSGNTTPHADSREMVMDANGNLIEGDDGGLYRRSSPTLSTGTWSSVIGNLACFEAHDVAYDSVANVGMVGTQDNGTHIQSAGNSSTWTFIFGGDGGDVAVDDKSTAGQSVRYGSSQNLGNFFRKTYNSSNTLLSTVFPARTVLSGGPAISVQFVTPIELNKVDPTHLIIGGANAAYESLNRGDSVTALTPISAVNGTFSGLPIAYGGYLAGVPNADILYYGSGSTVRVRTTAGGSVASTAAAFPGGTVQDIVLDSNDWQRVFVAGSSSVYVSANVGASWTNITGNLTGVGSIHTLEFFKLDGADCVAAGTDIGVFCSFSSNLGTWNRLGTSLPNAVVYDMQYNGTDRVLIVGTMGRSAFLLVTDTITDTPTLTAPATNAITANPVSVSFSLPETALAGSVKLFFTGAASRTLTLASSQQTSGAHSFTFNPANPTGAAQIASITGGATIPDGSYTVTLSYQDFLGNAAATAASTNVRIDTTPPTLTLPAPITVTATSPAGATVNYSASASDPGGSGIASSSFVPASGSTFAIGTTPVNATATDNAGNVANGSFTVTVNPNPPPSGGTFTVTPNTGVHQGDLLSLSASGWTDSDTPLTYQFFNGVTSLNSPGGATTLNINAPAPGGYTLKVRVTDSAGSFTDATQPLTVSAFTPIENWRQTFFGDYRNTGNFADSADFDLDGKINLLEFAFHTNPTTNVPAPPWVGSGPPPLQYTGTFAGGGAVTLTGQPIMRFQSATNGVDFRALFVRRTDHVAAGLTYVVEFSADMNTWAASNATPAILADNGTVQIVSVPYPFFVAGKKARFFQVTVTRTP